jgi:hypothetical protein
MPDSISHPGCDADYKSMVYSVSIVRSHHILLSHQGKVYFGVFDQVRKLAVSNMGLELAHFLFAPNLNLD